MTRPNDELMTPPIRHEFSVLHTKPHALDPRFLWSRVLMTSQSIIHSVTPRYLAVALPHDFLLSRYAFGCGRCIPPTLYEQSVVLKTTLTLFYIIGPPFLPHIPSIASL